HTRWPRDWSSDVCSSDLDVELTGELGRVGVLGDRRVGADVGHEHGDDDPLALPDVTAVSPQLLGQAARQEARERLALLLPVDDEIGRASCRERGEIAVVA